jgi:hypothetical protein
MTDTIIKNTVLREIADQTGKLFKIIKFVGTDDSTEFMANDEDKNLFVQGDFKIPVPELKGEFGIGELPLFNGFLRFPSYNGEGSKISVTREKKVYNGKETDETVTEFKFRDKNNKGANYRTMSAQHKEIEDMATEIPEIPWTVSFIPEKSKISEFSELASLCKGIDDSFAVSLEDGNLIFSIGDSSDSTHNAEMVFATGIDNVDLKKVSYPIERFLVMLKIVNGLKSEVRFTNRRIAGVFAESDNVNYRYFLRGKV